ncbi:tetratricopeptide repeat protein [Sphingobacterium corticis]|uniref:Tetratricopeptide repeat protein n=1 Tax=Sphingobacterium corticis TaxID=1812823 RepID=A0ABW5NH20_9SPHI
MSHLFFVRRLLCAVCVLICSFCALAQESETEEKTRLALLAYTDKEYDKAAELYEELLEKDYKNTYLLSQCGLSYYHQKKYEQAREKLRLATLYGDVNDKSKMALYYSNLSAAYSHLNDDEKAFENAVKAYYMDKSSQNRLWNAASMAQNLSRYDDCLKLMNDAETGSLNNAFQTLYARSYYGKQNFELAYQYYVTFFDHYDQNDDYVPLIIKDERNNFWNASLLLIAATDDEQKQNQIIDQVLRIKKAHPSIMFRQDLLNGFTSENNYCKRFKLHCASCEKVFRAWVNDPNIYDELRFNFYALHQYEKAHQWSTEFLKEDLGELQSEIQQVQFLSALHIYLADYKKRGNAEDAKKTNELLADFDNFFDSNTTYTDEQFGSIPGIEDLLFGVNEAFQKNFESIAEQRNVAHLYRKFMERIPIDSIRNQVIDMLDLEINNEVKPQS